MNRLNRAWARHVACFRFRRFGSLPWIVLGASVVAGLPAQKANGQDRGPLLVYEVQPQTTEVPLDGKLWCTAELTNLDDEAVTVYWGDYAYPTMYRFDIRNETSGDALPATRLYSPWPPRVPRSAQPRRFVTIQPGATASYRMLLTSSPGANCQQAFFRRPGTYFVSPSLHVTTDHALDRETGKLTKVPGAWTGALHAPPFTIKVLGDDEVLSEGIKISGTVSAPDGRNLADALVVAKRRVQSSGSFDGFSEEYVDQAVTGDDGRFEFFRLPAASSLYLVTVHHADYPSSEAAIVNEGKNREYATTIVLSPGETIAGRVIDDARRPVGEVRVSSGGRSEWTDEDGRFTLSGLPEEDEYQLDLWRPGYLRPNVRLLRENATSGQWQVTLLPESATTLTGRARFPDGSPVAGSRIEIHLTPTDPAAPDPRLHVEHIETDEDGGFRLVLPDACEYTAAAKAFDPPPAGMPPGYNIGRTWKSTFGKVAPESGPLEIVFENRCRLRVDLKRSLRLPESLEWVIQCYLNDESRQVEEKRVAIETESVVFERLGPGEYFVRVSVASAEQLNWHATTHVTTAAIEKPAVVAFEIPDVRFGSITARFLMPDGETPYRNGRVSISPSGGRRGPTTDDEGRLTLRDLPAGRVRLTPSSEGIARTSIEVEVVADETRNLGTFHLAPAVDEFGQVFGTVTYEDGTPALGAVCTSGYGMAMGARLLGPETTVDADGAFQVQLRAGVQDLAIDLAGAAGWPHPGHPPPGEPELRFGRRHEVAFSQVEVQAGQRVEHHVVLRRGKARSVRVRPVVPEGGAAFLVAVVEQGDVRISRRVFGSTANNAIEIADLPAGSCTLVFRCMHSNTILSGTHSYFAVQSLEADVEEAVFDASDAGTLTFRVVGPGGEPVRGLGLYLSTDVAGQHVSVDSASAAALTSGERTDPLATHMTERDDGSIAVSALGPGSYDLRVTSPAGWTLESSVEIAARQTTTVEWEVDAKGQPSM